MMFVCMFFFLLEKVGKLKGKPIIPKTKLKSVY